jgi:histidine phosphotransferase ChpT
MTVKPVLGDIDLTAFMSSRICHDLVGPIGAINNGLELLEEETDEETRAYAHEVILNSAQAAWTRLEFARLAFGASSSLGSAVDITQAEKIARGYVEETRHTLSWHAEPGAALEKGLARLLMMLIAISLPAVPGGGELAVRVKGKGDATHFTIRCTGRLARIPEGVEDILSGQRLDGLDPRSILPYYAGRLATELNMTITVAKQAKAVIFTCAPV